MRLHLICAGKLKAEAERTLADDYATRIRQAGRPAGIASLSITECAESRKETAAQRMAEEGTMMARHLPAGAVVVAFDERGKAMTSTGFTEVIRQAAASGTPDLVLLIGGPDGLDPELKKKANHIIALGAMTWPHRLARVMVLEQVYRSVTIILNHPYHRP